ncbi:MAG: TonB-dependent receptor, partial [Acidobacteria bacterium]
MKPRTQENTMFRVCSLKPGIAAFVILLLMATVVADTSGSLTGVVKDQSGALVPGVAVNVKQTRTGTLKSLTSDDEGRWTAAGLPPGSYEVIFEMPGFRTLVRQGVTVEAAVRRTLDVQLEVGGVDSAVTVSGDASITTPDVSAAFRKISSEELTNVPTSTRSFTHLLSAESGVSADLPPVLTNSNGNISPSVNGARTTSTSVQFNGIDATNLSSNEGSLTDNVAPSPETLDEVKLQTSLYDASTGRSGGGNFQLVTRGGNNEFHGSAYWYVQNEKFNANDYFYNRDGIERPRARRNEGGFVFGGPIVRDRTFFFGGYQRTQAQTGFVPTAESVTILPQALSLIPGERTAANVVEAFKQLNPNFPLTESQISPIALKLLNLRNPATGGLVLPGPRGSDVAGADQTVGSYTGGNPLVRQRNVTPAEFEQDQFTLRVDHELSQNNRLTGNFFYSDFPAIDPFPDPSSLASPFSLRRDDRGRMLAVSDFHTFSPGLVNEARFGLYYLNNTRRLDDPFLNITNEAVGIPNPATFFDNSDATRRLGHYVWRNNMSNLSFGGPNDSFNRRDQRSFTAADSLSWVRGAHNLRFGAEAKRHHYDTNLPEEQATEFEKFENFTQFLAGFGTEADTQFGITDKRFRMHDLSWFVADDWKVSPTLTLNLGVRWDWFGWPTELDGRIGNLDLSRLTDPENPANIFTLPENAQMTGFNAIDATIAATARAENRHTLAGQDLNNFQPRIGFAYSPWANNRIVLRGGYGIFFDRPSAAFMNTVFSNYPFLREIEVTAPSRAVPLDRAFSQQDPNLPFLNYLPNRLVYQTGGSYVIRDATPVTQGADGSLNPIDLATGLPALGNVAETLEFRAIDRNLRTPYVQQWNFGIQFEVSQNLLFEARYVGTKGTKLLEAIAFNQPYDLNNPDTPDHIFGRLNRAYEAAYQAEVARTGNPAALNGPLASGATERQRGQGVAFGFVNPVTGQTDLNFSRTPRNDQDAVVIPFEARGPIVGFNIPEALLLQNSGNSIYHGLQLNLTRRFWRGFQLNGAYTWSKSIDTSSADPGSTAGGGRPDVPNVGFVVQGNQFDRGSNRAVSDFDRPHRFSLSFVYDVPVFGATSRWLNGWQISGFVQAQSGTPFSIFSPEPETRTPADYLSLSSGSGGLYRLGFGRPNLVGTLDDLRRQGADPTEEFFNTGALAAPLGGFGNLGR